MASVYFFNHFHLYVSIHILHSVHLTFSVVLTKRIFLFGNHELLKLVIISVAIISHDLYM